MKGWNPATDVPNSASIRLELSHSTLTPTLMSDTEVDEAINVLIKDLEATRREAKRVLQDRNAKVLAVVQARGKGQDD